MGPCLLKMSRWAKRTSPLLLGGRQELAAVDDVLVTPYSVQGGPAGTDLPGEVGVEVSRLVARSGPRKR